MTEHIGRLLKQIHTIMERNFNNMMNKHDLTAAQMDMLVLLFRNKGKPMCQKDIEEKLMLKNPTVTGTLSRLETKGFIERVPYVGDRRFKEIHMTDKARELDATFLSSIRQSDALMLSGFSEDEKEQLLKYLHRLIDNMTAQGGQ